MHKKLDLRGDDQADMSAHDLNSAVNDQDGDGFDDRTGEPIVDENELGADDVQPTLACPLCGFELPAPEPTSISTEDPEAGSSGGEPVEGDLCPNCGEGVLESTENLGAGMEGGGPDEDMDPEQDPDAELDPDAPVDDEGRPIPDEDEEPDPFGAPSDGDEQEQDPDSDEDEDSPDDDPDSEDDEKPAGKKPFPPKR
jgi:hypothetical protein